MLCHYTLFLFTHSFWSSLSFCGKPFMKGGKETGKCVSNKINCLSLASASLYTNHLSLSHHGPSSSTSSHSWNIRSEIDENPYEFITKWLFLSILVATLQRLINSILRFCSRFNKTYSLCTE